MSKVLLSILSSALYLLVFSLFPNLAFAATLPYQITEAIPNLTIATRGITFLTRDIVVNYQSGRVLFSGSSDGTGTTSVDDGAQISVVHADGSSASSSFEYHGNCFAITPKQPQDITSLFRTGENRVTVRLYDVCGTYVSSSAIYLVNTGAPDPIPPGPTPFLELPWDYQGKGLSFNEAALSINSYFDHEYPLLSSGLSEPVDSAGTIINYLGPPRIGKAYTSHDGYDYGRDARAYIGDPVLAAAAGVATYVNSCAACGNMIEIDHGNGYQIRYMHLQRDELITNTPGQRVNVTAGQQIGRVGATGNVRPIGEAGAHIHFMVVQDKNNDGNFDDNIPDGVTDPFGWQSRDQDPWPTYVFNFAGQSRTGNRSYYLWTRRLDSLNSTLTASGGQYNIGRYTISVPRNTTNQNLNLQVSSAPITHANNDFSIGSIIKLIAQDAVGDLVQTFQTFFSISVDFSSFDLSRYNPNTISFYSSTDGTNWTRETTSVDLANRRATTLVNHMTYFALMAERADTVAPTTTANLSGDQGQTHWFRSDVSVSLNAQDNEGGLGIDYTLYRIGGGDWEVYSSPLTFTNEGHHKVEFYSVDKDENIEDLKSIEFDIDKTVPQASIDANPKSIWSPNGKMVDITITGSSSDDHLLNTTITVNDEYHLIEPVVSGFGQTIQLEARRNGSDLDGRMYIIKVVVEDLAGNQKEASAKVIVPHDQDR